MGYDFRLVIDSPECKHCHRSDYNELLEMYMSYNHGWAWRKFVNAEVGFRSIYDKPLKEVKFMCEKVIDGIKKLNGGETPVHIKNVDGADIWASTKSYSKKIQILDNQGEPKLQWANDDGWARTYYNAFRCANDILKESQKAIMSDDTSVARWNGD